MGLHPKPTFGSPPAKNNPWYSNLVADAIVTLGAEAAHAVNASIKLIRGDAGLKVIAESGAVGIYLSDDADGGSIAASAPSSGWAIGTNGLLIPIVANKYATFISETTGLIDVTITEATLKNFYMVIILPSGALNITKVAFGG